MQSAAPPDPIFTADGDFWSPSPIAAGPFGGLHGGAVSGLIVARLEAEARRNDAGIALSASVLLLRPAPMRGLQVETRALRLGGRASAFEAVVTADGERIAQGAATFARPALVEAPLAAPGAPAHPENLPVWEDHPSRRWRGFFDALEIRDDNRGCKWGRLMRPLTSEPSPLADVFAVADCATAFDLSSRGMFPAPFRHPNIDIAIHVSRRPGGAWVGVAPYSDWRREAVGLTEARLFDELGVLGRSCQAIVIIPREK
jgi:Thioesterase-like superfamily